MFGQIIERKISFNGFTLIVYKDGDILLSDPELNQLLFDSIEEGETPNLEDAKGEFSDMITHLGDDLEHEGIFNILLVINDNIEYIYISSELIRNFYYLVAITPKSDLTECIIYL